MKCYEFPLLNEILSYRRSDVFLAVELNIKPWKWWRHGIPQIAGLFVGVCEGNPSVAVGPPPPPPPPPPPTHTHKKTNKQTTKKPEQPVDCPWFEPPWRSCDVTIMYCLPFMQCCYCRIQLAYSSQLWKPCNPRDDNVQKIHLHIFVTLYGEIGIAAWKVKKFRCPIYSDVKQVVWLEDENKGRATLQCHSWCYISSYESWFHSTTMAS